MRAKTVVIVGANPLGYEFALRMDNSAWVKGFFDDREIARLATGFPPERLLGTLADLPAYLRENAISHIYISLPIVPRPRVLKLVDDLRDSTASVYILPDLFAFDAKLDEVKGFPVVAVRETPFLGFNAVKKRAIDIVLASVILLFIWPVLLGLAIGVRLSSPGPVLCKQRCYGLDGEGIVVYKFRTTIGADDQAEERKTRFARFLRKTSLDKLPQFINVLQGRMSVVGPEPHAVARNEWYRQLIDGYMQRHKVRPGITGWAQVNEFRGETETVEKMRKQVEYDLDYLRHWSLWLELEIIIVAVRHAATLR